MLFKYQTSNNDGRSPRDMSLIGNSLAGNARPRFLNELQNQKLIFLILIPIPINLVKCSEKGHSLI